MFASASILNRKRNLTVALIGFILIWFALFISFILLLVFLQARTSTPKRQLALQQRDKSKFYDAVFKSYDPGTKSIYVQITKDGLTTEIAATLSAIPIKKIKYDHKTLEIISEKDIAITDLKDGDSVRLVVSGASINLQINELIEIDLYEN